MHKAKRKTILTIGGNIFGVGQYFPAKKLVTSTPNSHHHISKTVETKFLASCAKTDTFLLYFDPDFN